MTKRFCVLVMVLAVLLVGVVVAVAQHPMLDKIAERVIQKYQQSSCEQLWQQKGEPKPPMEQNFVQLLQSDPQLRTEFINKVAAPIANKMFECGMIP
jgi:hypothetical protein